MSEMCCMRLAENTGRKKIAILAQSHNFLRLYLRSYGMYRYFNATHLPNHAHLSLLSCNSFSFFTGHVSLPGNIQLQTQLLYNFTLIINDTSLLVSRGTSCLNLYHSLQLHQHHHLHSARHVGNRIYPLTSE